MREKEKWKEMKISSKESNKNEKEKKQEKREKGNDDERTK